MRALNDAHRGEVVAIAEGPQNRLDVAIYSDDDSESLEEALGEVLHLSKINFLFLSMVRQMK